MINSMEIFKNLGYFSIFVIGIALIASLGLNLYLKKFEFEADNAKLYGMLFNLDNKSIVAFVLSTLSYLFLVWTAMMSTPMNMIYVSIIVLSQVISVILVKDYIKVLIALIVSIIECASLYLIDYIHVYLLNENTDILMRFCVFFMVAFAFIYFTYNYINSLNDIVSKNRHVAKKKRGRA